MVGALERIASTFSEGELDRYSFPWEYLIDREQTELVWRSIADRYKPATALRDAAALRVMVQCCRKVGLISDDECASARDFDTRDVSSESRPGRMLTEEDIQRLIAVKDVQAPRALVVRDAALILTLATTGARRNELSLADLPDAHLDTRELLLRRTKSGKPRTTWLHPNAAAALTEWLSIRGDEEGALFLPLGRTGRPLGGRRLSAHQMWKILRARAEAAGIGHVTPHDMRRFVASSLLDQGVDMFLTAKIMGHKRIDMTARYDRRPEAACRRAVDSLPLPRE